MLIVRNEHDPLNQFVSEHFRAAEFRCKCGDCRITLISEELLRRLERVRCDVGMPLLISSGYRCQAHNRALGGAEYSFHMSGNAADVLFPQEPLDIERLFAAFRRHFPFSYMGQGFIHGDTRGI